MTHRSPRPTGQEKIGSRRNRCWILKLAGRQKQQGEQRGDDQRPDEGGEIWIDSLDPIFARIAVSAAKPAEPSAQNSQAARSGSLSWPFSCPVPMAHPRPATTSGPAPSAIRLVAVVASDAPVLTLHLFTGRAT